MNQVCLTKIRKSFLKHLSIMKSQMGLMDEAYGIGENRNPSGFTSGSLLDMVTVYESGSWPETVIQGQWSGNSAGEASLATSFDFNPPNDNRLHLYTQTGTGTLIRTQQVATDSVPMAMAKGDLNHDGLDDVAVVNQADETRWGVPATARWGWAI